MTPDEANISQVYGVWVVLRNEKEKGGPDRFVVDSVYEGIEDATKQMHALHAARGLDPNNADWRSGADNTDWAAIQHFGLVRRHPWKIEGVTYLKGGKHYVSPGKNPDFTGERVVQEINRKTAELGRPLDQTELAEIIKEGYANAG